MESKCKWVRLGDYIEVTDQRNKRNEQLSALGINKEKVFMPTAANMEGIDLTKYKIVKNGTFVFSGMQTGRDMCIRIALYRESKPALISPAYTTFEIDNEYIINEFLYIFFNREESDRYGAFLSDSSVRANLDWERFLDIKIPLPSLEEQQKVVNAWKALREIKEQNEAIAAPLMQMCQSYLQELKHKYPAVEIGEYIEKGVKNSDGSITMVLGIGQKGFIKPQKVPNENLKGYKVMSFNYICYAPPLYNILSDAIHIYKYDYKSVCSPIYETFKISDKDALVPEYLLMWLKRDEFKRYAEFYSIGVRNTFDFQSMCNVRIPLPPISVQQAIVNIYNCANEAKQIAAEADRMSREVCPALIQHVINTAI